MKIETLGSRENPAVVMLNGSFTTGRGLMNVAEPLAEDFFVVLPTYDGHYENGGCFTTRQDQAEQIYRYLIENGVTRLALVHGVSMGAEVAMELVKLVSDGGRIALDRAFLDGGPFFHFPAVFYKVVMRKKFLGFVRPGEQKQPQDLEKLLKSGIIRFMLGGEEAAQAYLPMIGDMMEASRFMTKQSVCLESDACYTFDPPRLPKEIERRLVFSWSDNEPARKSSGRMQKAFPDAQFRMAGALGHCGFLVRQPEKYVALLQNLAGLAK